MAAVKYTVANSIIIKIANKPKTNEIISVLFLFFKLNPIKIGKTGKIQGDKIEIKGKVIQVYDETGPDDRIFLIDSKIEITPVIKETNRKISIISPHIIFIKSSGP